MASTSGSSRGIDIVLGVPNTTDRQQHRVDPRSPTTPRTTTTTSSSFLGLKRATSLVKSTGEPHHAVTASNTSVTGNYARTSLVAEERNKFKAFVKSKSAKVLPTIGSSSSSISAPSPTTPTFTEPPPSRRSHRAHSDSAGRGSFELSLPSTIRRTATVTGSGGPGTAPPPASPASSSFPVTSPNLVKFVRPYARLKTNMGLFDPDVDAEAAMRASAGILPLPEGGSSQQPVELIEEIKIPALLQQGTPMMKMSSKKGPQIRKFRLDAEQGQILWESKKFGVLSIENIREMRTGANARNYREFFKISAEYEPRWLTIVYTFEHTYKTLHVVALSSDVFNMWNTTLRTLYALRREMMSGLASIERRQLVWEKQYWKGADASGDERLDFAEVQKMCQRLNIYPAREDLVRKFKEADSDKDGLLDFADFQKFVKLLKARPDIERLFAEYAPNGSMEYFAFENFMRETQKSTAPTEELQRLFEKYSKPHAEQPSAISEAAGIMSPGPLIGDASKAMEGLKVIEEDEKKAAGPAFPTPEPAVPSTSTPAPMPIPGISAPGPTLTMPVPQPVPAVLEPVSMPIPAPVTFPIPDAQKTLGPASVPLPAPTPSENLSSSQDPIPAPKPTVSTVDTFRMSLDSFTAFLLSSDNAPFLESHGKVVQDMTRPMSEYYISSSHNTYLIGNQLMGSSTVEGYIRALLQGCRSVELDIWDGDKEPFVYHGKTLTSKVSVRDIARAIAKYAFVASPYPVIISAEIHCKVEQQDMVAQIMREEFGEALITGPLPGREHEADQGVKELPSPEEMKARILLKTKKLVVSENKPLEQKETVTVNDDSETTTETTSSASEAEGRGSSGGGGGGAFSRARGLVSKVKQKAPHILRRPSPQPTSSDSPPGTRPPTTARISTELTALLVYTVGVKCRGLNKKETYDPVHLFSLSERTANKIMRMSMSDLIKHNRTHVIRIYPAGMRLNSSNYEPHRYWAAGAQLCAINWQTMDLGFMINYAMFQRNGGLGYVLKPEPLRIKDKQTLGTRTKHFLDITVISAQQLPRPKDSKGREIVDKAILDPFVEVSVHLPEWMTGPSTPPAASATSSPPPLPPSSSSSKAITEPRSVSVKTKIVKNNGFNPVWEEEMSIPFDLVGGPSMKDLVFVRFEVRAKGEDEDHPVGVYCVSLGSLQMGYRHLPLHDLQMSQYLFSTLFVKVEVRDVV